MELKDNLLCVHNELDLDANSEEDEGDEEITVVVGGIVRIVQWNTAVLSKRGQIVMMTKPQLSICFLSFPNIFFCNQYYL